MEENNCVSGCDAAEVKHSGRILGIASQLRRNSACQKVLLWLLFTHPRNGLVNTHHEYWRDYPQSSATQGNVAGRYRKAHRAVALLSVSCGERTHDSFTRYAGQDCGRHGSSALAIFQ